MAQHKGSLGGGVFSIREVEYLESLPAVDRVRSGRIVYNDAFKRDCIRRYRNGESPAEIFRSAGLDSALIGYKRIERSIARWKATLGDDGARPTVPSPFIVATGSRWNPSQRRRLNSVSAHPDRRYRYVDDTAGTVSIGPSESRQPSVPDTDTRILIIAQQARRIPEISVDLPIYHGTSESALASGAGHLYGSSLPVGGASTHSVITGHRGLVEAMMFTRLDEMKVDDYFYIDVMGETLGYRVDRIEVIEPDDTSRLKIVEGEDRVTLMTCTPYGVNTHRLLVSGVRAAIPGDIPPIEEAPHDPRVAAAIAVSGTLLPLLLLVAFLRRGPWNPMRHGARWPKHW